jgi:hypothetical protein
MKLSRLVYRTTFLLTFLYITVNSQLIIASDTANDPCQDCFSTELQNMQADENCVSVDLLVTAENCAKALSHITVEVPCGTVAEVTNSGGFKMLLNETDPTTHIWGFKVDNIENFAEDGKSDTLIISYTICSSDQDCLNLLQNTPFKVAYKAGTCVFIDTIKVDNTAELTATIDVTNIACYGESTGRVDVTVSGGWEPYSFQWNTGETTEDLTGVPAGIYSVKITDSQGQEVSLEATVEQSVMISVQESITSADCGSPNGEISVTVDGGVTPYQFQWSNGESSSTIQQLVAGNYSLQVTDAVGCIKTSQYVVTSETSLKATLSTSILECHEEGQGEITVNVTGGDGNYSYLWSNGETTQTVSNLVSGSYGVTITDGQGCSIQKTAYVTLKRLYVLSSVTTPTCQDPNSGSVSISVRNGSEPYSVLWSNGETTMHLDGVSPGWYWVEVTDANGCTYKKNINVPPATSLEISTSVSRVSCDPDDSTLLVTLSASGGTEPYVYTVDNELVSEEWYISETGVYEINVVDAAGCEVTKSITVIRPEQTIEVSSNVQHPNCDQVYGSVQLQVSGGTAPYAISWQDGSELSSRSDLQPGDYQITVVDANGCEVMEQITINEVVFPELSLLDPDLAPCNSTELLIEASVQNVVRTEWEIISSSNDWFIQDSSIDQLIFTAGTGTATIVAKGYSNNDCVVDDVLELSCSVDDDTSGGGNGDGDQNNGDEERCDDFCFDVVNGSVVKAEDDCYRYSLQIITDGSCAHELSHVVIGTEGDHVVDPSNSRGWKMEWNSLDPTTQLFGLKVDDIEGFGKDEGDELTISFTMCGEPAEYLPVAFKAAQCVARDTVPVKMIEGGTVEASAYPNPFTEAATIEVMIASPTDATLEIFDIHGNLVKKLHKGELSAGVHHFNLRDINSQENIFFYRLITLEGIKQGKLIRSH